MFYSAIPSMALYHTVFLDRNVAIRGHHAARPIINIQKASMTQLTLLNVLKTVEEYSLKIWGIFFVNFMGI